MKPKKPVEFKEARFGFKKKKRALLAGGRGGVDGYTEIKVGKADLNMVRDYFADETRSRRHDDSGQRLVGSLGHFFYGLVPGQPDQIDLRNDYYPCDHECIAIHHPGHVSEVEKAPGDNDVFRPASEINPYCVGCVL